VNGFGLDAALPYRIFFDGRRPRADGIFNWAMDYCQSVTKKADCASAFFIEIMQWKQ